MLNRNNNSDVSEYLFTNQLFDDGTINEWATFNHFNHFNTSLGINSRLAFELDIEDKWLKSGALVDEFPQDEISGPDQATLSILNEKGILYIDREEVDFRKKPSESIEWCTPIGSASEFFVNGNRRIRLTGTLGCVSVAIGSCIGGQIVTYRLNNNGNWRRNRERLCVGFQLM